MINYCGHKFSLHKELNKYKKIFNFLGKIPTIYDERYIYIYIYAHRIQFLKFFIVH